MSSYLVDQIVLAFWQTVEMTLASGVISLLLGLPLAILLVVTASDGLRPMRLLNRVLGGLVNAVRSLPFIVLLVALIPFTRLIAGTSIGTEAAIVPLSLAATPYFARVAEVSLREVDQGLVEALRAMGGSRLSVIREVLLPEALPGLISGFTLTLVTLVGASAMAGAIGAGGLGDLAIRYGYQRFETNVMIAVVAILIVLVSALQWVGDRAARHVDKRA